MKAKGIIAVALLVASVGGCSRDTVTPNSLDRYLIAAGDLVDGEEVRANEGLSGDISLPRLRDFLPIGQDVTLELRNGGFQAGRAAGFETTLAPGTDGGPLSSVVYQSIALSFFSVDGAAQAMRLLRAPLKRYSPQTLKVEGSPGDERFLVAGAPGSLTPTTWLVWRRRNVVVVFRRAPGGANELKLITPARNADERVSRA